MYCSGSIGPPTVARWLSCFSFWEECKLFLDRGQFYYIMFITLFQRLAPSGYA